MATKIKKTNFTKAFTKTKLAYLLDREIAKGDFIWTFDYKPKLEDNGWHPSSHCTPSVYELYHYAKNRPIVKEWPEGEYPEKIKQEPIDASLGKTFQVGHFWHQYLQEIAVRAGFCGEEDVERRGYLTWYEGDKKPWQFATGSGDIAPCKVPGHGSYLIDFKTMGSHTFRPDLPHPTTLLKWECQINIYMTFFDLERAMIIGINKDAPHDMKEYEFHYNEPLAKAICDKWKLVSQCLDEGVEPPEDEVVELPTKGPVNV